MENEKKSNKNCVLIKIYIIGAKQIIMEKWYFNNTTKKKYTQITA